MAERTEAYQREIKAYVLQKGYSPESVAKLSFASDQEAYDYTRNLPPAPKTEKSVGPINLRFAPIPDGGIQITEMFSGNNVRYVPSGTIHASNERILAIVNSMRSLGDENLPEFLGKLAKEIREKG